MNVTNFRETTVRPTRSVGKHYNRLTTPGGGGGALMPIPIWDIREFEIKGTVGPRDKVGPHLSGVHTSVRIPWWGRSHLKASYSSHQRDVIMPNSYPCHLDHTESDPLVTFLQHAPPPPPPTLKTPLKNGEYSVFGVGAPDLRYFTNSSLLSWSQ